ncbi:hypothetical protein SBA4_130008 [Candidatus Sulfopaludibacter sp. SbA4]|nr:hypothetical protein SBA4_130008 [Candidatus Sulfopaludibacter sp. SbA4]
MRQAGTDFQPPIRAASMIAIVHPRQVARRVVVGSKALPGVRIPPLRHFLPDSEKQTP